MSKNHPNDNIYSILGKLNSLTPKEVEVKVEPQKVYESVEAKGSILEGVSAIESRLKQQFAESANGVCTECGMNEGECEHTMNEREFYNKDDFDTKAAAGDKYKSAKHDVTKTDRGARYIAHPPADDHVGGIDHLKGPGAGPRKGRPRKEVTKNPRRDPNAPKGARGRPKKADAPEMNSMNDLFGRVKASAADMAKKKWAKEKTLKHVDEKAVSQSQQKFMGMVHAAQKGEKAASPEVAKVAKTMGKKDAKDFASTKHKGLPQHVAESVNFKRMMEEQHMTLSEMLECMNADMQQFKETGVCSDRLRDMMEVYAHAKKQMEETIDPTNPRDYEIPAVFRKAQGQAPLTHHDVQAKDQKAATDFQRRVGNVQEDPLHAELNELAKLAGLQTTEGNAFSGKLAHTAKGSSFEQDGKTFTNRSSIADKELDEEETDEGNAFGQAVRNAKADGVQPGEKVEVGGKEIPVKEADAKVNEPKDDAVNKPKPKYGTIKQITSQGDDLNRQKKQFKKEYPGDNPTTNVATLESRLAAEYESIKKVSK